MCVYFNYFRSIVIDVFIDRSSSIVNQSDHYDSEVEIITHELKQFIYEVLQFVFIVNLAFFL